MPKARTPLDVERYQALKAQGLSQRHIAQALGIPESTLRDNLRLMPPAPAREGIPMVHTRRPEGEDDADSTSLQGIPQGDEGGHQGKTSSEQGIPPDIPMGVQDARRGIPSVHQGIPNAQLTAQDLTDLQSLLAWWRSRTHLMQEAHTPARELERHSYHVEKRWIDAVRREADLTGESYAAIVNRAFAQYFTGKST